MYSDSPIEFNYAFCDLLGGKFDKNIDLFIQKNPLKFQIESLFLKIATNFENFEDVYFQIVLCFIQNSPKNPQNFILIYQSSLLPFSRDFLCII